MGSDLEKQSNAGGDTVFLASLYTTQECRKTLVCAPEEAVNPNLTSASGIVRKLIPVVCKPLNLRYSVIAPGGLNLLHQVILRSVSSSRLESA